MSTVVKFEDAIKFYWHESICATASEILKTSTRRQSRIWMTIVRPSIAPTLSSESIREIIVQLHNRNSEIAPRRSLQKKIMKIFSAIYFYDAFFRLVVHAILNFICTYIFASLNKLVINLFRTARCYAARAVHHKIEFMIILIIGGAEREGTKRYFNSRVISDAFRL